MTKTSFHLRYPFLGEGGVPPRMMQFSRSGWEIAGGLISVAVLGATAVWLLKRKRPTADELEQRRRQLLVQSGRIVDGMLQDINELTTDDGSTMKLLVFSYRIGGVDYECSQDITALDELIDRDRLRLGFPCSVRYQPGNPQNSIVVAEGWSGLRAGLTQFRPAGGARAVQLNPQVKST